MLPPIILRVTGGKLAVPVITEAHFLQLRLHVVYVFIGPLGRVGLVFDRGVFGWKAKGVPAHRMQDIKTFHPFVAGHNITDGVVPYMAHMDPAGGIGEHLKQIVFLPGSVFCGLEGFFREPFLLPFFFNCLEIVYVVFRCSHVVSW